MILHLLKTDWQRLRWPILGVWFILLLASLPWLLHNPDGFEIPMSATSSSDGNLRGIGFTIRSPLNHQIIQLMVVSATLLLSTAIGMHDQHWQAASPIRPWKRFAAKTLGLFLFIVVPQLLLGCGVMLVHGFDLPLILTAAGGITLTLLLFHGTAALFGRCCASFWAWSAAAVCLSAITRITGSSLMLPIFWSEFPGPGIWLIGCVSLLGIALLPRLFRTRPGSVAAITTAIAAIVLPGFIPQKIPSTIWLPRGGIDTSGIEALLSPEGLQLQSEETSVFGRTSFRSRYTGQVLSSGAPADTYLSWQAGDITLDPTMLLSSIQNSASRQDALRAILPAPLSQNFSRTGSEITFYELDSPNSPSSTVLTGVAFRYEKLCDLPLDETPAAQVRNQVGINARLHHSHDLGPLVEITLRHPSLGISKHCDAVTDSMSWYGQRAFTYVLYLPKRESCIELSPSLTQTSPLPGGGVWNRFVLATVNGIRPSPDSLTGARLIILQPVLLDVIKRELPPSPIVNPGITENTDWMLAYRYGLSNAAYLKLHRPFRPDPATCSAEEFARYLRAVSSSFPYETVVRDLAEYVPRFPGLLALYTQQQSVGEVIGSAVPESAKDEILGSIEGPHQAFRLASELDERGWQTDTRDALLACLDPPFMAHHGGQVYQVVAALAELEDPGTYPALLAAYERTQHSQLYEIIRDLPGITPELDQVIERVSETLPSSPVLELTSTSSAIDTLSAFSGPVSHGNPIAFTKFLSFIQDYAMDRYTYLGADLPKLIAIDPDHSEPWHQFLTGKSASDFIYDPLARRWQLLPSTR